MDLFFGIVTVETCVICITKPFKIGKPSLKHIMNCRRKVLPQNHTTANYY